MQSTMQALDPKDLLIRGKVVLGLLQVSLLCNPDLTTDLEEDRIFSVFESEKQFTSARCYYQLKLARVLLEIKKHKEAKLGLKTIDLFELSRFQAVDTAQEPESALDNSTLFKTATDIDLHAAP
jgi:hypothetical protein